MQRFHALTGIGVAVLLLFLLCSTSFAFAANEPGLDQHSPQNFVAHLSAASGVTSRATGEAIFHLSAGGNTLSYKLIVANINNVFMAHIHFKDGNIILWLYPNPNAVDASGQSACIAVLAGGNPDACPGYIPGRFDGILAQGTLTAANLTPSDCAGCNGFTFQELISAMETGSAFVNVHTTQNPGGELQGTIE